MTASATSPFIPPFALRCWVDGTRLYIAYPAANQGADFVVAYDRNAPGLTCAIAAMAKAYDDAHPQPRTDRFTASPATRIAPPGQRRAGKPAVTLTEDERASAHAVLIALGILPPTAGN